MGCARSASIKAVIIVSMPMEVESEGWWYSSLDVETEVICICIADCSEPGKIPSFKM